jgi:hypothetical protein
MKILFFTLLLAFAPLAYAIDPLPEGEEYSCPFLMMEWDDDQSNDARALVELSRLEGGNYLPTLVLVSGTVLSIEEREMVPSQWGKVAPVLELALNDSLRARAALRFPASLSVAAWERNFLFFVLGQNGTLHLFQPSDPRRPSRFQSVWIPRPKQLAAREKITSVKTWKENSDGILYVYLSTSRGRIFRSEVWPSNYGPRPENKWELVAQNASKHFDVLLNGSLVYLDAHGSIWLQTAGKRDWLAHFYDEPVSFSAYEIPRDFSDRKKPEDRVVVWMTGKKAGIPTLYRWRTWAENKRPEITAPDTLHTGVPWWVSARYENSALDEERVALFSIPPAGESPFPVHLKIADDWIHPWLAPAPSPDKPKPQKTKKRPPAIDVAETLRARSDDAGARSMRAFFEASGIHDPAAVVLAYRLFAGDAEGLELPLFYVPDHALLANVFTSSAGEALDWIEDLDLYEDFQDATPRRESEGQPHDARGQRFPLEHRQFVVITALHGLQRHFHRMGDPTFFHKFLREELEVFPAVADGDFWEFLDRVYKKLSQERRLEEGRGGTGFVD